jgi:hypothetical protein
LQAARSREQNEDDDSPFPLWGESGKISTPHLIPMASQARHKLGAPSREMWSPFEAERKQIANGFGKDGGDKQNAG